MDVWVLLQIAVAVLLFLDGACDILWASQTIFAVEAIILAFYSNDLYLYVIFYVTGALLEAMSVKGCKRFGFPRLLLGIHSLMCLANCRGLDCLWQFRQGRLFWAGYWLNNAIIVLLICYCLPSVYRRLRENDANTCTA